MVPYIIKLIYIIYTDFLVLDCTCWAWRSSNLSSWDTRCCCCAV